MDLYILINLRSRTRLPQLNMIVPYQPTLQFPSTPMNIYPISHISLIILLRINLFVDSTSIGHFS